MSGRDRYANSARGPPPRGGPNYNDRGYNPSRSAPPRGGARGGGGRSNNNDDYSASVASSAPIDPNMPDWWNAKKKAERRQREEERRINVREENERTKMGYNNAPRGNDGGRGNARVVAVNNGAGDDRYSRKAGAEGVGARQVSDFDDTKDKNSALRKKMFMDGGAGGGAGGDDRLRKIATADEELEGRSLMDLVDRGTLMVGLCLILIVVIAVTIPVALISEDEPYVAPAVPDPPSASPTMARQQVYWDIFDRVQRIAGGPDVLGDPNTAQNRALNWIVFEDGMELGPGKDHLHQSGPWTPVEGRLEWGSPVHECEWEGITCKDVEELEA
eukprot:scaffold16332_cov214-Skeletonema_marinoi.AAC.1